MHPLGIEDPCYARCISRLFQILRAAFPPFDEWHVPVVSNLYPPILDFAASVYDAQLKFAMDTYLPDCDVQNFRWASSSMVSEIEECLVPKYFATVFSGPRKLLGTKRSAGDLLWDAWGMFRNPSIPWNDRVQKLRTLLDEDVELVYSIMDRLWARQAYWEREFDKAVAEMRTPTTDHSAEESSAAPTTVAAERDALVPKKAREVSEAGLRLVKLKEESGLSWRKIAEKSGVAERQLYSIAREGAVPKEETKACLIQYFSAILSRPITL